MKAKQTILMTGVACGSLAILGGLLVPGIYERSASADMKVDKTLEIEFEFDSSLTLELSSDKMVSIDNLVPGRSENSSTAGKTLTVKTTTNNSLGYTLSAKVDTTDLVMTGSTAKLASITSSTAILPTDAGGVWGYSVNGGNYNGFTAADTAVVLTTTNTAAMSGDLVRFDIGAYAPETQPSGKYENKITFTSVANPITD